MTYCTHCKRRTPSQYWGWAWRCVQCGFVKLASYWM